MACSVFIAVGVVAVAGMLLAALAFSTGARIIIPLVATFDGVRTVADAPIVRVDGSWSTVGILVLILSLPPYLLAIRYGSGPEKKAASSRD